jgi:hypothetical protein
MNPALKALAAACLAVVAAPVLADAHGSASFGSVTVTLIDLNPNDGIAPSISFLQGARYEAGPYITGEAQSYLPGVEDSRFERVAATQTKSLEDKVKTSLASSSASVTAAANGAGFTAMSVSGAAESAVGGYGHFYSYASVPAAVAGNGFVLSPNTMVSFSAFGSASADYTLGYTSQSIEGERASAVLTLYVSGAKADGSGDVTDFQQQFASVYSDIYGGLPGSDSASWNGVMSASYSNLSTHSSIGHFYAETEVGGLSVSAVPEPATYGMLLAGLGTIGIARRRRRGTAGKAMAACAALLTMACALPAHAGAVSSAAFGNLVITLTDLDPNDGVTPSLTFEAFGRPYVGLATHSWGDEYVAHSYSHEASQPNGVLKGALNDQYASATASLTVADTLAGFSAISLDGHASSAADGFGHYEAAATGANPFFNGFTLSANTRMTISTTASMATKTTIGYNLEADQGEFALASLLLGLHAYGNDGKEYADSQFYEMASYFNVRDDGTTMGESSSWNGLMSIAYSNYSAFDSSGYIETGASIAGLSAMGDPAPVPEPHSYAMMLAGLALVGAVRRQARR